MKVILRSECVSANKAEIYLLPNVLFMSRHVIAFLGLPYFHFQANIRNHNKKARGSQVYIGTKYITYNEVKCLCAIWPKVCGHQGHMRAFQKLLS